MKKVTLIMLLIGGFVLLVGIGIQSWLVHSEGKASKEDQLAKARAAKARKAKEGADEKELNETVIDHGEIEGS